MVKSLSLIAFRFHFYVNVKTELAKMIANINTFKFHNFPTVVNVIYHA